jgi:hypothetical protein
LAPYPSANYVGLTAQNVPSLQLGGNFALPREQEIGMFGLPGEPNFRNGSKSAIRRSPGK